MTETCKSSSTVIWNDSFLSWPPDPITPHSEVIMAVNEGITELLRNGAQKVLISYAAEDTKKNHNIFRTLCKNECITFSELGALCYAAQYDQVKHFLEPIIPRRVNFFMPDIAANQLELFLCNILIANRVRAHIVDQKKYGPSGALWAIEQLRNKIKDPAIWRIYDRLEGLIRSYAGLTSLRIRGTIPLYYADLKKIMRTDDYLALSTQYNLLGTHSHPANVLAVINDMVRHMATSPIFSDILRITSITTSVVASAVTPVIDAIEYLFNKVGAREDVAFIPAFFESSSIGWQQYNVQNTKDG